VDSVLAVLNTDFHGDRFWFHRYYTNGLTTSVLKIFGHCLACFCMNDVGQLDMNAVELHVACYCVHCKRSYLIVNDLSPERTKELSAFAETSVYTRCSCIRCDRWRCDPQLLASQRPLQHWPIVAQSGHFFCFIFSDMFVDKYR
jgi:hypothetical protein